MTISEVSVLVSIEQSAASIESYVCSCGVVVESIDPTLLTYRKLVGERWVQISREEALEVVAAYLREQ